MSSALLYFKSIPYLLFIMFCMTEKFSCLYKSLLVRPSLVGFNSEDFQSNSDIISLNDAPTDNPLLIIGVTNPNIPDPLVLLSGTKEIFFFTIGCLSQITSTSFSSSSRIKGVVCKSSKLLASVIGLYSDRLSIIGINFFLIYYSSGAILKI